MGNEEVAHSNGTGHDHHWETQPETITRDKRSVRTHFLAEVVNVMNMSVNFQSKDNTYRCATLKTAGYKGIIDAVKAEYLVCWLLFTHFYTSVSLSIKHTCTHTRRGNNLTKS